MGGKTLTQRGPTNRGQGTLILTAAPARAATAADLVVDWVSRNAGES